MESKKCHVLILPYPSQGHINPLSQFAKRLVATGKINATLVTTVLNSKSMLIDPTSPVTVDTISDGFDDIGFAWGDSCKSYLEKFKVVGSKTLAELLEKLRDSGRRVDCIVYDSFLPWVADVGKRFGVVTATFFTQAGAVNSIYYHVYKGDIELPIKQSILELPCLPVLEKTDFPSFLTEPGTYPGFTDMVFNQFSNLEKVDWVFFNFFYELEQEVVDWFAKIWRVRTIGPTLPSMYLDKRLKDDKGYGISLNKPDSNNCITWLDTKPKNSVIYVSFGSLAELSVEQMHELAWGLKDSNHNFLWVVRGTEEPKIPANFAEQVDTDKFMMIKWAPQLAVLAHESVGCFVTHCGFNSVLEALGLGVPMVGVPQWTDQAPNIKLVQDVWKVGIRAKSDENGIVRKEELVKCVREVMEGKKGEELKTNSVKWKTLARKALDDGGSSDKNITEFVLDLLKSC